MIIVGNLVTESPAGPVWEVIEVNTYSRTAVIRLDSDANVCKTVHMDAVAVFDDDPAVND